MKLIVNIEVVLLFIHFGSAKKYYLITSLVRPPPLHSFSHTAHGGMNLHIKIHGMSHP